METIQESMVLLIATPIIAAAILLEFVLTNLSRRPTYSLRGVLENCYLTVLNMAVDLLSRSFTLLALTFGYEHRVFELSSGWVYWVILLICEDFAFYWLHWVDHRCRLFWAIHVTHHSAEEFNLTVGFRSSVFQPLYRFIYFLPLSFLGFAPTDILIMYSLTQLYGILLHTEYDVRFGVLEHLLVTPTHHRVHHGSNEEYIDKNLGMVFIIWDKIFGTFQPLTTEVKYGITKAIKQRDAFNLVFHEWKEMVRDASQPVVFRDKLRYIFGRPGWRHRE